MGADDLARLDPQAILIWSAGIAVAALFVFGLFALTQTRRTSEHFLGDNLSAERAEVVDWTGDEGYVRIGGELWKARSKDALAPGDPVRVTARAGFLVDVRRAPATD